MNIDDFDDETPLGQFLDDVSIIKMSSSNINETQPKFGVRDKYGFELSFQFKTVTSI